MAWRSRLPRVYRFLEKRFVDDFFSDGRLRLSSVAMFGKHEDEQRLDGEEGSLTVIHRPRGREADGCVVKLNFGKDSYVLSGSTTPSKELMQAFGADSGIVILDPKSFGLEIAKTLPHFIEGFDGPCSYQEVRLLEGDFGDFEFAQGERVSVKPEFSQMQWSRPVIDASMHTIIKAMVGDHAFFLKHRRYLHQNEWRFVWRIKGLAQPYFDVDVPDARKYCARWEESGDVVAF